MRDDAITVITLTCGKADLLKRAIESVRTQDYPGFIEHLIIIDEDPNVGRWLPLLPSAPRRRLCSHLESRPDHERGSDSIARRSVYPRLARLLNIGVRNASSPWLAFLDDDNAYERDHLSSLMACVRAANCRAVHSARAVYWRDGTPYLEPFFPGAANAKEGARIYELMCDRGVWIRGTNILQDRVDPASATFHNSTMMGADDPIFLVDQNLWLIDRSLVLDNPISEEFTDDDIAANTCPDDKMLEGLVRNGVQIISSRRPTLRYYLGGISNGEERTPEISTAVGCDRHTCFIRRGDIQCLIQIIAACPRRHFEFRSGGKRIRVVWSVCGICGSHSRTYPTYPRQRSTHWSTS